jgi:hypothetical protein
MPVHANPSRLEVLALAAIAVAAALPMFRGLRTNTCGRTKPLRPCRPLNLATINLERGDLGDRGC